MDLNVLICIHLISSEVKLFHILAVYHSDVNCLSMTLANFSHKAFLNEGSLKLFFFSFSACITQKQVVHMLTN